MMHRRLTFWLALIGLAIALRLVLQLREKPPVPPPVAEPARAPYANPIGARGLVEAVNENVRVAPAVAGLVVKVHVQAGDEVAEGAVLFEQDQRDARALVAAQEAQLEGMKAQMAEAEVALADRQDQWSRIEELSRTKVASLDERQRAKFAADLAAARLATMRADFAAAEAQLQRSKVQLELLTVRAARAGRVLQVNIRPGEYAMVAAGEPAILLGQVEQLQLRADVDEDNASRVRPGAAATAFPKGRRDVPIPLSFVRIEPYIVPKKSLTGESGERVDTRVLQVIYHFTRPEVPVYVGQQMDVFLDGGS